MPMTRHCGGCQLCCRLLPTEEINKPALARCPHQKHGVGCAIYAKRPMSCRLWNCRWLVDESTRDLPRPDRAHYVIDLIPDFITVQPHDGTAPTHMEVIQVWVDPAHRGAHRAPSFRRWLDQQGKPAIVRYSSIDGFVLFPACMTGGRGFIEFQSRVSEHVHTLEEKAAALGGTLEIDLSDGTSRAVHTTLKVGDREIPVGSVPVANIERAHAALRNARQLSAERAAQFQRAKEKP